MGISKLARVMENYANRLQIQEKLTSQVVNTIYEVLQSRGIGVVIEADDHSWCEKGWSNNGEVSYGG